MTVYRSFINKSVGFKVTETWLLEDKVQVVQIIIDIVKNYRVELGTGLDLALEAYSGLFIQQFENFYKKKLAKETELKNIISKYEEQTE